VNFDARAIRQFHDGREAATLEMGRHDPPLSQLAELAKALGLSVAELLK
jgi:hypothetical protein